MGLKVRYNSGDTIRVERFPDVDNIKSTFGDTMLAFRAVNEEESTEISTMYTIKKYINADRIISMEWT